MNDLLLAGADHWYSTDDIQRECGGRRDHVNRDLEIELRESMKLPKSGELPQSGEVGSVRFRITWERSASGQMKKTIYLNRWGVLQYSSRLEAEIRNKLITYVATTEENALLRQSKQIPTAVAARLDDEARVVLFQIDERTERIDELAQRNDVLQRQVLQAIRDKRKEPTKATKETLFRVVNGPYHGFCACCRKRRIVTDAGIRNGHYQVDHFFRPSQAKLHQVWAVCDVCNQKFENGGLSRDENRALFEAFQHGVRMLVPDQQALLFRP